jgi:hypothetical protein
MTNYTIQGISNANKLFIFIFFAASLLLTATYSYAQCLPDIMANKSAKNTNDTSLANVMKSKQEQQQQKVNNTQTIQPHPFLPPQQQQEGNEQKTEDIRVITTLINTPDQLTGKAKVTVTFIEEDEKNQITFQSNNKTITAEEEIVFPLTLVKAVNEEEEEQPSTMNVCAVVEGFENTCDTVLLVQNQTKPYKINLELINFEEVEPLS